MVGTGIYQTVFRLRILDINEGRYLESAVETSELTDTELAEGNVLYMYRFSI